MQRWLPATTLAVLLAGTARPAVVDGVTVADTVGVGGTTLVLNGAGKRTRFFFNVYVGALYLRTRSSNAQRVLAERGPKRMSMTLMRHVTAGELVGALREGIARNSSPAELARTHGQIDSLLAMMAASGGGNEGEILTIDFLPDGTTRIARDGRPQGAPIKSRALQRELLEVWLGPNPVQADLKRALLGR
ncbi:MAG TPA: chalcone isomerase family protein [Steroidobacteraceae bacterium]|nr:chalcone isomerase family protein [Steroidobacteraceae bacterium]